MKDIKFKIDSNLIDQLKHLSEHRGINFTRDLLIKTDTDKSIIVALLDLSPYEFDHQCIYRCEVDKKPQISKTHFMFYVHEAKIKMREMKYKYGINPIAIPPCTDYDIRIFDVDNTKLKSGRQYFMEMTTTYDTSDRVTPKTHPTLVFTFPISLVPRNTQ